MAGAETASCGIPDFGLVVERTHLLRVAQAQNPALAVVCAPPGYGKSVFAAQCARALEHDEVIWVPLYDTDVRGDEWLGRVVDALSPSDPGASDADRLSQYVCAESRADLALKARDCLAARDGRSIHLILDGAGQVDSLEPLLELAATLRRSAAAGSRLTVTCRSIATSGYVPDPASVWMISTDELRFSRQEIVRLLDNSGFDEDRDERAADLIDRFAGHPALTSLMLRHQDADGRLSPPLDLVWHVQRLIGALPDTALALPYCAALLREGSALEVDECMVTADEQPGDWRAMQVLAPLLTVERDGGGVPVRFRMHGVMCGVLLDAAPTRCRPNVAAALRAGVLDHLTRTRDSARLQALLLTACTRDEVAHYCETHWSQLLRAVGPDAVGRCLSRVPAVAISASAPLLVLRAAVLREHERSEEAAMHASLAQRIAETDGDWETQAGAILLGVSSALEVVDLVSAREILGQIHGTMRSHLDLPTLCLIESYQAVLDAYRADHGSARLHLTSAVEMLEGIDTRSWEAASAVNCVAGALGQMMGRWDMVRSLMMRAAEWPGATPLRRLQIRANTAVSDLEMGCLQEADRLLSDVIQEVSDAGCQGMAAYALSTLADVRWFGDPVSSAELYSTSQALLGARQDEVGVAVEQAVRASMIRTEGALDESLALADSAAARLRSRGSCADSFRLASEIEVAASMLALGDRWGARKAISSVLSELVDSGAGMHLLLSALIMAELERQEGRPDVAVSHLRPHADYVATGSANWRLALYVRAFPGLLGLLVTAFGAEDLPLRMLRLLPEHLIDSAAALSEGAIAPNDHRVLLARARGGENGPSAGTPPAAAAEPACHVRLFGGLEVTVAGEPIPGELWRKRKVRLLFAMLASRCGQDIPRDVLLERLWPDMDDERARRNFYVTWSAVKRALANGGPPSSSAPLLRSSGGVCRITRAVRVDLEDFDEAIAVLRRTDASSDSIGVLAAARRLTNIYRGELLPGDIYEEWFAETRERAKHDFCDAMVVAARAAEVSGDPDEALALLRRAGVADPWREDIYQAMMRCQMLSGQRSRAIETYIACRGRLVDDLGIDPSAETTRLYQAVLAMKSDVPVE